MACVPGARQAGRVRAWVTSTTLWKGKCLGAHLGTLRGGSQSIGNELCLPNWLARTPPLSCHLHAVLGRAAATSQRTWIADLVQHENAQLYPWNDACDTALVWQWDLRERSRFAQTVAAHGGSCLATYTHHGEHDVSPVIAGDDDEYRDERIQDVVEVRIQLLRFANLDEHSRTCVCMCEVVYANAFKCIFWRSKATNK